MTKTPAMVLQEFMTRKGGIVRSEILDRENLNDPFQCEMTVDDVVAIGIGRTKKDAKQNAAEIILQKLHNLGKFFPSPDDNFTLKKIKVDQTTAMNNVGKLQDLCNEYTIPSPVYECLSETGPPHSKLFTMRCSVATIERTASSSTKKLAKQSAAAKLLDYFKNNAPTRVADMEESCREISRMNELALSTFTTMDTVWKPNLGQLIDKYHLAFRNSLDERAFAAIVEELKTESSDEAAKAEKIFGVVECPVTWSSLPCAEGAIAVASVPQANPPICVMARNKDSASAKRDAARRLLDYVVAVL